MKSKNVVAGRESIANSEQIARIFLKPRAGQNRAAVWLAEALLRPFAMWLGSRSPSQPAAVETILVFDPGGLGDMMLLLPFLRNLRARFPRSHVTHLGNTGAGGYLLESGMVDDAIELRVPWRHASRWKRHNPFSWCWLDFVKSVFRLRKKKFDLAFSAGWAGDLRGNLVIWLAGASRRVGYGYGGGDFLLTDVARPDLAHPHVADRNLQLVAETEIPHQVVAEPLCVTPEEETFAAELLAEHGITKEDLAIGVHPYAGSAVREWGDARFAEVAKNAAERFGAKILWFKDPLLPRTIPADLDAISLTLTFRQFVAVVSRCQLFLCNDSGPMHVAAALRVPVVAVFGPQRPEWFGPYGEGHRVVIRHDIWCRPCADHCIFDEPHCLRLISVDQVTRAVTEALNGLAKSCNTVETLG